MTNKNHNHNNTSPPFEAGRSSAERNSFSTKAKPSTNETLNFIADFAAFKVVVPLVFAILLMIQIIQT